MGIFRRLVKGGKKVQEGEPEEREEPRQKARDVRKEAALAEKRGAVEDLVREERIPDSPLPEISSTRGYRDAPHETSAGRRDSQDTIEKGSERRGGLEGIREWLDTSEGHVRELELLLKSEGAGVQAGVSSHLRIRLGELRLLLAEAGLGLIRAETETNGGVRAWESLDEKLSLAEEKCREVERMLLEEGGRRELPATALNRARLLLGRQKIALVNSRLELVRMMTEGQSGLEARAAAMESSSDKRNTAIPSESGERMRIVSSSMETMPSALTPERPRFESEEPAEVPKKDPVILGALMEELPPLDAGIAGERVRIREEGSDDAGFGPSMDSTKVKVKESGDTAGIAHVSDARVVIPEEREEIGHPEARGEEVEISVRATGVEQLLLVEELNRRGVELRKAGRAEEAITFFDRVLEIDPANLAAYHNRGVALRTLGRYGEALANFERVLQSDPENRVALFNKAYALCRMGRLEEGVAAFDRLLALDPSNAAAWFSRGRALLLLGKEDEGNESIRKARDLGFREGGA